MQYDNIELSLVTCVSDVAILKERLLASPCLQAGRCKLVAYHNARSAAEGFNSAMAAAPTGSWLVWVHQDVYLPLDWELGFIEQLARAKLRFPGLAVAGVYGVVGAGALARRAGHVLDRGTVLREAANLPCLIDSLDELLFAVSADSALTLDPQLGFDFYATDLVLTAQEKGLQCVVLDAYCEHWSGTPAQPGKVASHVLDRIHASATVFERKWVHRLPVATPCFDIRAPGDTFRFLTQGGHELG